MSDHWTLGEIIAIKVFKVIKKNISLQWLFVAKTFVYPIFLGCIVVCIGNREWTHTTIKPGIKEKRNLYLISSI